jgi:hypothetical protein
VNAKSPIPTSSVLVPARQAWKISNSVIVWFVLGACLALVSISLTFVYPNGLADPNQATLFTMPAIGIIWGVGLIGVLLSEHTGFPDAWNTSISARLRLVLPVVVAIALGMAMVTLDYFTHFSRLIAAHHGLEQQYTEFMPMFLAFSVGGSILVEVIYRLLPIPLLLWLISLPAPFVYLSFISTIANCIMVAIQTTFSPSLISLTHSSSHSLPVMAVAKLLDKEKKADPSR